MRICLVSFEFPPFSVTGRGTQSYDLAFHLSREGMHVHVLTTGEREESCVNELFKITRLKVPLHDRLRKIPTFQFKVWRWLKNNNENFDVIHFQQTDGFFYLLMTVFTKQNNIIETFHHSQIAEFTFHLKFLFKAPKESLLYLLIPLSIFQEFFCLRRAENIVTVSNMSQSALLSWGIDSRKITVIPNAINQASIRRKRRKTTYNSATKFLYVGRLYPSKGIDILIEAIDILKGRGINNFHVDIVGQGPLLKYCQRKIEAGNLRNCNMKGFVSQQELAKLYQEADCLICPSRLEGFGIVLLEAAANNLAIIANNIPVFKEIFTENEVLYFKGNDPYDLAEKISELSNNPSLISILQGKARDKLGNYLWQNVVRSYIGLYSTVLEERRAT